MSNINWRDQNFSTGRNVFNGTDNNPYFLSDAFYAGLIIMGGGLFIFGLAICVYLSCKPFFNCKKMEAVVNLAEIKSHSPSP